MRIVMKNSGGRRSDGTRGAKSKQSLSLNLQKDLFFSEFFISKLVSLWAHSEDNIGNECELFQK